jgi:hypothetical protein
MFPYTTIKGRNYGEHYRISLPNLILGTLENPRRYQAINGNRLDNRRKNLKVRGLRRLPIPHDPQPPRYQGFRTPPKPGHYRGVHQCPQHPGVYRAAIMVNGRLLQLGVFATSQEAAAAWDHGAVHYRENPGYLNFPDRISEYRETPWPPPRHRRARVNATGLIGVRHDPRYLSAIDINHKSYRLGYWATSRGAAEVRELVIMALQSHRYALRNYPDWFLTHQEALAELRSRISPIIIRRLRSIIPDL